MPPYGTISLTPDREAFLSQQQRKGECSDWLQRIVGHVVRPATRTGAPGARSVCHIEAGQGLDHVEVPVAFNVAELDWLLVDGRRIAEMIGGQHRLVALVARLLRVARHLRVARGAAGRVALGGLGVIAAERDRVIERALGQRQVVARRDRRQRLAALLVAGLADPHAHHRRRARGVVVARHAALDPRRPVIAIPGRALGLDAAASATTAITRCVVMPPRRRR